MKPCKGVRREDNLIVMLDEHVEHVCDENDEGVLRTVDKRPRKLRPCVIPNRVDGRRERLSRF